MYFCLFCFRNIATDVFRSFLFLRFYVSPPPPPFPTRQNTRERTEFYKTLARLVFIGDYDKLITPFMLPIKNVLVQLEQSLGGQRNEQQKQALIGVCRDLRGIFSAALGSHTYGLLFNNIYPKHMRPLTSAASIWGDTPEVMNPLLKFYMELVNTKGMRIKFPPSSANGILLFREISSVVVAYGNTLLRQQKPTDTNQEYSHWYKGKKKQWCSFAVDRVVLH